MKFAKRLLYASVVGLAALTSCAKQESEPYNKYETMALASWMRLNRPELLENRQEYTHEGQTYYYYVDVLDGGRMDAAPVNDTICWVKFDFSGRDLNGKIVLTRNEMDAKLAGTFTRYTRYVPFYRYCGEANTGLIEGVHLAMRNKLTLGEEYFEKYGAERGLPSREVLLREGSRVVLYMPSALAGSVQGDGGYEGESALDGDRPFIVTMEIRDTVKNPIESEGTEVDDYCKLNGGLKVYDTKDNKRPERPEEIYGIAEQWVNACDTVPQIYVDFRYRPDQQFTFPGRYASSEKPYNMGAAMEQEIADALLERFYPDGTDPYPGVEALEADSVTLDKTAKIWYIGRFLDGFIFDTNIDEVKKIIYGEVTSKGTALEYKPSSGSLIKAFYYTVPNLKFGQWATLITASTNAYGASGKSGSTSTSTSSNGYTSSADYLNYLNYMNYANSYYGNNGYYGGYYGNYFNNYYGGYYGGYGYGYGYGSGSTDTGTTTKTVTTEIPPFTPLIFQFYIEPAEAE